MRTRNRITVALTAALVWLATGLFVGSALSQDEGGDILPFLDYHNESDYLPQSPSVTGGAAGAFGNPAAWATGDRTEMAFWWNDRSLASGELDNWGVSLGHHLGFAALTRTFLADSEIRRVNDYQLGLALGGRARTFGLAYRWSGGDTGFLPRENALVTGLILRPSRFYSYGLAGTFSTQSSAKLGVFDLGIRPLGDDRLTIFGDYTLRDTDEIAAGRLGAGVEIRALRGLHLGVKVREADLIEDQDFRLTVSLGVVLGAHGFNLLPGYSEKGDRSHTTFLYRHHPSFRGLPVDPTPLSRGPRYVAVNLENKHLTYQRYRLWDKKRVAWVDLAWFLDAILADGDVDGVALNLAGFSTRPSLAWELRRKLLELQAAGKEIVVHTDELGMLSLYLASVADELSLDPQGLGILAGAAARRTYLKGTLDKLGIGFQELRFFTHKSAVERFSRTDMSDADREQFARLIDVIYETARDGVCQGRGLTTDQYDAIIENDVLLTAELALQRGLVDRLSRWAELGEWLQRERDGAKLVGGPAARYLRDFREEVWGELPRIAVVYAVGECAMDSGIKGRATSEHLRKLAGRHDVAAVVLRADSPGGMALPSDLVAEALLKLEAAGKPVVVSQGDLAASGGYWISMNGERILTTPLTITGSIGVIAGWFWDAGLGEKVGLSVDGVQRGSHADLFGGMRLPFLGAQIPMRPLDDEEFALARDRILALYDQFVRRVASGRDLTEERVRELGEGRVWMGGDALERGLVDEFGSLQDAIALAQELAGLDPDRKVTIEEFPRRPLFEWPTLGSGLPGLSVLLAPATALVDRLLGNGDPDAEAAAGTSETVATGGLDYDQMYLRALAGAAGEPTLLTPPEALPDGWQELD